MKQLPSKIILIQGFTQSETLTGKYFAFFIAFLLFIVSCGDDDKPDPGPEPIPNVTHTININGNTEGATYTVFDNGAIKLMAIKQMHKEMQNFHSSTKKKQP